MAAEMTEAAAAPVPAGRNKISSILLPVVIFAVLALVPLAATFGAEKYVLALVTRVMIFAIAAIALDLLVGYRRARVVWPRRVRRPWRLCGRHPRIPWLG